MAFQDFPPPSMLLSPRLTTTGDPSGSLQGINTAGLADGAECYVSGLKTLYRLDLASTDAPAGDAVIAPSSGPGRWKPAGGGAGSVLQVQTTGGPLGDFTVVATIFATLPVTVLAPLVMQVTPGSKVVLDAVSSFQALGGGQLALARITKQEPADGSPVQVGVIARLVGDSGSQQQLSMMGEFVPAEDSVEINVEFLTNNAASGLNIATGQGPVFIEATEVAQ